ncbi:aconitase X catalytic domain-containing protein [Candidatus Methanocrinis natronophilus]|uniref:Phosphomevalonate dehydratase large subunit n=1 Tax=Candidatus Methanocrinis natronophilus TaxID=3033396 RepID=A0ABT5XAS7_9EURY|nr:aconitase X catalytic domain-containing protein [Candidatus Methanocrinis natronophilus]MDF0591752.1 aconitase X catalytic domain-containing protein [Candidatus Methanocrinis natronophilus]
MHLSREEERAYQGELGDGLRRAMEILVALGDIYGADRLIPVRSVQVAGVSFKTIGEAGLEWISDLRGSVVVPTVLNPAGMDLTRWREMGIDERFAEKQLEIVEAYRRLGVSLDCTCTPYQIRPDLARRGDHLAWSESSAVSFANSVIGAKTNREGGPSALAAALVGKTPRYGYHLEEKRIPTHRITVDSDLEASDYGILGYIVGREVGDGVPWFIFRKRPDIDELKTLGAAMAASGSVALYYFDEDAPSAPKGSDEILVSDKDLQEVREGFAPDDEVEVIAIGCPHSSERELAEVARLLEGKKVERELWICTARAIAERRADLVAKIERSGARVFCDTCMVVSPAGDRYRKMMVNSGKALAYVPTLCKMKAAYGSVEECVGRATGGV